MMQKKLKEGDWLDCITHLCRGTEINQVKGGQENSRTKKRYSEKSNTRRDKEKERKLLPPRNQKSIQFN